MRLGRDATDAGHTSDNEGALTKTAPIVLIADDFVDARDMYAEYLTFHGYQVVTAIDGLEALTAARQHRPDIILLDIRMPGMSGTEAMQVLKSEPAFADVPIVALTAHARSDERDAAMAAGFDDFLSKPISPDQLVVRVAAMLDARK
jgi:CheY-like chemotaxis protein